MSVVENHTQQNSWKPAAGNLDFFDDTPEEGPTDPRTPPNRDDGGSPLGVQIDRPERERLEESHKESVDGPGSELWY